MAALAACGETEPPARAELPEPERLAAALVRECHGDLVGFDRFVATVTLSDGGTVHVQGSLPHRLRAQWPDGAIDLLDEDRATRLVDGGKSTRPLDGVARDRLFALRKLLDAAALGPVRRSVRCELVGPRVYLLHQADGTEVDLELRDDALRVSRLGAVHVLAHLDTSASHVVRSAEIAPLGRCTIRFEKIDFAFDESIFDARATSRTETEASPPEAKPMTVGAPRRPAEPTQEPVRAQRWLCVPDPGDWGARSRRVQELVARLREAGQTTAGFQGLAREGERDLLVVPFRGAEGKPEWSAPADWDVREVPAGRALAVYPPSGDFAERRARGEAQLAAAQKALGLEARGLVLAQPFLHLDENEPDAAALAAPVVRVAVILR